ncbi:MAG: hypothetical protein EXQ82_05015, partial [Pseudolabrys sp.]|nr:hypothetical protein [Pseudolabrys sp.]
ALLRYTGIPASYRRRFALCHRHFNLTKQRHNLLCTKPLLRHDQAPFQAILSQRLVQKSQVRSAGETIEFRAGETIHTENSYKYSIESLGALARGVGWEPAGAWTDARKYFSIQAFTFSGN